MWIQGSNSDHQACQQAPLPTEPTYKPMKIIILCFLMTTHMVSAFKHNLAITEWNISTKKLNIHTKVNLRCSQMIDSELYFMNQALFQ